MAAAAGGAVAAAAAVEEVGSCEKWLVFGGKTGWIGQKMVKLLQDEGKTVKAADSRLENRDDVAREIDDFKPDRVLNCAGLTGRPNVDWCEDHKADVNRVNVIGTLSLLDLCETRGIHVANFATGCIYTYDEAHPMGSGKCFTEEDAPNFFGSYYSTTKGMVEKLSRAYENTLTLRFRMPISDDLNHRNFITKICKYRYVVNIPNSMTILSEMLPVALGMSKKRLTGVFNFTNPGALTHNQILDLYKSHIDERFWYENFSLEQQDKILKAGRSNCELETAKLVAAMPEFTIRPAAEAIVGVFERMAENLKAEGNFPPENVKGPKPE